MILKLFILVIVFVSQIHAVCPVGATIEVTPDHLAYGRPGTFFSNRPWSRFLGDRSEPYQPYHHTEIKAVVRDSNGNRVEGCTVQWETGVGAANGWIFPVDYVIETNVDGEVFFYWGAGTYTNQAVTVYFEDVNGDRVDKVITGKAGGERCLGAATYYGWSGIESNWLGFKTDIKILTSPGRWYYAVFLYTGMYTGIKTGGSVIYSMWNGSKQSEIIWPEAGSPEVTGPDATHYRSINPNSVEGSHVGTGYTPAGKTGEWWLGKTWGFELELEHFPNIENTKHTDATVWFTDYEENTRTIVGKIRYFGSKMARNNGANLRGFKEHVSEDQMNCLKVNRQHVVYSNSAYRKVSDPKTWDTSPLIKPNSMGFQFAKMFSREADGAHFSSGGMGIGYPNAIGWKTAREVGVSCFDGVKNGLEYDIDCGGTCEKKCPEVSLLEQCMDGIRNGKEKGVDCNGGCPNKCGDVADKHGMIYIESNVNREHLGHMDGRGMTWHQGKAACEAQGKILAFIDSEEQNLRARDLCGSNKAVRNSKPGKCWIGIVRDNDCRTPSCYKWEGTDIWHDQTVFNHWGVVGAPRYQTEKGHTYIRSGRWGEWATIAEEECLGKEKSDNAECAPLSFKECRHNDKCINNHIHHGASGVICTDKPKASDYPEMGIMTDEIFVEPSNPDELLPIAKSVFYYDTECITPHLINDVAKTDYENSKFDTFEDHFKFCADDGGVCKCDGMVRFGLYAQKYYYQEVTDSIPCGGEGGFHTFPHMPQDHKRTCQCLHKSYGFTMKTVDNDFFDTRLKNGSTKGNADGTNTDGALRWKLNEPRPVGCVRLWDFKENEIPRSKFIVTEVRGEINVCKHNNPCKNDSLCKSVHNEQVCVCSTEYEGKFCENKVLQSCVGFPDVNLFGGTANCSNLTKHGFECEIVPDVTFECDAKVYCDNGDYILEGSCQEIQKFGSECTVFGGVVVDNLCYYINDDHKKYEYEDAVNYCKSQDSIIASVHNQNIYDNIIGTIIREATYLGAKSDGNGIWKWENGNDFDWKPNFNNGLKGIEATKIVMTKNGKWHDWKSGKKKSLV